jgi:hypothetical protein
MSFLDTVETSTRAQVSLSPGSYGSGKEPGLKILAYIDKASKLDKSGAMRHSFLVAATKPSREAAEAYKSKNGSANPLDTPDFEGTAFLSLSLNEFWLNMEATSLAFTEASRNKDGVIQHDNVAQAIADGDTTQEAIDTAIAHFRQIATDKVIAANTPAENLEAAIETQYGKELTQISIKVGQFVTLQDWKGVPRSLQFDPTQLVGTEFSGKVETREFNGKSGAEVTSIYSKAKK